MVPSHPRGRVLIPTPEELPYSLKNATYRASRHQRLQDPHIAALTEFVHALRRQLGPSRQVPYFDPLDGGINAKILFFSRHPAPKPSPQGFAALTTRIPALGTSFTCFKKRGFVVKTGFCGTPFHGISMTKPGSVPLRSRSCARRCAWWRT